MLTLQILHNSLYIGLALLKEIAGYFGHFSSSATASTWLIVVRTVADRMLVIVAAIPLSAVALLTAGAVISAVVVYHH